MAEITIDLDKCEGAGQCIAYCPSDVYKMEKMEEYKQNHKNACMPMLVDGLYFHHKENMEIYQLKLISTLLLL